MRPEPDPSPMPDAPPTRAAAAAATGRARSWLRASAPYAGAAAASILVAVLMLRLWTADLRVPFDYGGDAFFFSMITKTIVEAGGWLTNARLGAPGVLELYDFPLADLLHNLAFKGMALFSSDWALLFNLYYLAGFPLITLSALAVFRHFRVAYAPALAGSLLYAFLPTRLLKGEAHLQLDIFYQVPLAMLAAIWVFQDEPPLVRAGGARRWPGLDLRRPRSIAALAIAALTAATGLYYAFFSAGLILLGGASASLRRRTIRNVLAGALLVGVILAGLAVQALPTVIYQHRHGPNPDVAAREADEAEFYGMKLAQLLLPAHDHRFAAFRKIKERYEVGTVPPTSENATTSLGAVGVVGFLFLLAIGLGGPRPDRPRDEVLWPLAVLNLLAILIGTLGGFGALFALLVSPGIRTYGRIAVLISFLSLFASVLLIERLGRGRPARTTAIAAMVLYLGLFDQVTPVMIRHYRDLAASYRKDAAFVARVEAGAPAGGMVFVLPYQRFPEAPIEPGMRMDNYDQLRFYLHSRSLRWSYPAMQNRADALWISRVAAQEPARMVATLADAGFIGIMIDRYGYPDAAVETALGRLLGVAPLVEDGGREAYYDLQPYARAALANLSAEERERRREDALHPVHLLWREGFYGTEHGRDGPFRWSWGTGVFEIANDSSGPRQARLAMTVAPARGPTTMTIQGDLLSERLDVPAEGVRITRSMTVPPGHHLIRLAAPGRPAITRADPRTLVWRIENPVIDDLTAAPPPAAAPAN